LRSKKALLPDRKKPDRPNKSEKLYLMKLRGLKETAIRNQLVLFRSPYDIGVRRENGRLVVKDDQRIRATLPTLHYLLGKNCRLVILTWVGRPNGQVVEKWRTTPHALALSKLLKRPVKKVDDCLGPLVEKAIRAMRAGEILMLENTRFYPQEMTDDEDFARKLAKNGQILVFDAFPQAHRIHASTTGLLRHLPSCAGFYLEKEVNALSKLMTNPDKPFILVIGGAKISDKIMAINNLYHLADKILLGGGMANLFLKAKGYQMGSSFVEDIFVDKAKRKKIDWRLYAKKILAKDQKFQKIFSPVDLVVANGLKKPQKIKTVRVGFKKRLIPKNWFALDIGPETQKLYCRLIIWQRANGLV